MSGTGFDPSLERRHVIYSGRVQGVGFRATTQILSANFAVTGFVRNLPDGTVELEAQGAADQVESFLTAVSRQLSRQIDDEDATRATVIPGETAFRIR